jgi:hypothetical protein
MKKYHAIDYLPTIFGITAILGLLGLRWNIIDWRMGFMMEFYGGIGASLVGLISAVLASYRHSRGILYIINISWSLIILGLVGFIAYRWSTTSWTF